MMIVVIGGIPAAEERSTNRLTVTTGKVLFLPNESLSNKLYFGLVLNVKGAMQHTSD